MKLMLITPRHPEPPKGGRAMLSHLHRQCLASLLGEDLLVHELERPPIAGIGAALRAMTGRIDGVTAASEQAIVERIGREGVSHVYLNGSNLGRLAKVLRRAFPKLGILTFFHNVEARFFLGALKSHKSPRALAVLAANHAAERSAVRFSDRLIALAGTDAALLGRLYRRKATDILPMAIEDQLKPSALEAPPPRSEGYLLFVGGEFYANRAGIEWFAEHVAPHIGLRICVVGHGMTGPSDPCAALPANVEWVGPVDELGPWYLGARAAIAPIFDGSGMKTKVAEALMHGKRIIGTAEAFAGYEEAAARAGWTCRGAEDFIGAVREVERMPPPRFDRDLRAIYERLYSAAALRSHLSAILGLEKAPASQ